MCGGRRATAPLITSLDTILTTCLPPFHTTCSAACCPGCCSGRRGSCRGSLVTCLCVGISAESGDSTRNPDERQNASTAEQFSFHCLLLYGYFRTAAVPPYGPRTAVPRDHDTRCCHGCMAACGPRRSHRVRCIPHDTLLIRQPRLVGWVIIMSTRTFPLRKQVFVIQTEPRRVLGDVDIECSSRKRGSKPWAFATGRSRRAHRGKTGMSNG